VDTIPDERFVNIAELDSRPQEIGEVDDILAPTTPFSKRDGSISADER
jgi:hypothetical protein